MCKLDVEKYFNNNRAWATALLAENKDYFNDIKEGQKPKALLLGCSDSRVSPATVLGSDLGDFFIHRNIANVVSHSDLNFLSVMQYAVESLGVRDIIVYGHYGCGGIKAAYDNQTNGLIDNWLANIKDVIRHYRSILENIPNDEERLNKLVELNVLEQIENIRQTSIFRDALSKGTKLNLHAWVFDFSSGLVHDLQKKYAFQPA